MVVEDGGRGRSEGRKGATVGCEVDGGRDHVRGVRLMLLLLLLLLLW